MDRISALDRTVRLIRDRLNLISTSQEIVSSNLANVTTPGYVSKELTFQQALTESLEGRHVRLVTSSQRHLNGDRDGAMASGSTIEERGPVDLEAEMMKLAHNSVEFQFMVTMLNKKFALLKHAISEGGS
jgi:flagellar basal-body rod protein FlgB